MEGKNRNRKGSRLFLKPITFREAKKWAATTAANVYR